MHAPIFLAGKSEVATKEDLQVAQDLLDIRLENVSLREPLSDHRAANANPYRALIGARGFALSTKKER